MMNQDESIESQVALLMAESKLRKVIYNYCSMQDKVSAEYQDQDTLSA